MSARCQDGAHRQSAVTSICVHEPRFLIVLFVLEFKVPKLEGGNKARGQSQTAKLLDEWERRGKANKISEKIISPQIVAFPDTRIMFNKRQPIRGTFVD